MIFYEETFYTIYTDLSGWGVRGFISVEVGTGLDSRKGSKVGGNGMRMVGMSVGVESDFGL